MKNMIIIVTLVLLVSTTGYCATYYVNGASGLDTNPGTIENPWKTIYKANKTLVAGDTVYIRGNNDGTYLTYSIGAIGSSSEGINPVNSGTSSESRITYAVYPGEKVHFVGNVNDSSCRGIVIVNRNWIRVTGYDGSTTARNMKFSNMAYFLLIWDGKSFPPFGPGSHYNEIAYCEFTETNPGWVSGNYAAEASKLMHNSTYNWIHHNTFSKMGGYTSSNDISACLNLGWEDCGATESGQLCSDESHDNVIEDNIMYHGGHHVIGLFNYNNVLRNNIFHNEQWYLGSDQVRHGYRVIQTQSTYNTDYHHSYNLIEGNRISHASENMILSNKGGTGIHLSISYTIIRHNDFYANAGNSIYVEVHDKTYGRVNHNHIYNNTFFANGYGATFPTGGPPGRGDPPDRSVIMITGGPMEANYWNTNYYGTVLKNNLSWKNYRWLSTMMYNNGWGLSGCSQPTCGNTVDDHNWQHTDGDPKFSSEGSYSSPSVLTQNYEWYWRTPDGSDVTSINSEPVFTLLSSSPVIGRGTHLTQANGSGTGSTTLIVDDANYFQPGWGNGAGGGANVAADWIAIGTVSNVVQIISINYNTNTITLASPTTWSDNANIWLYKKSDGKRVLTGDSPEIGAHAHEKLSPPGNVQVQ